MDFGAALSSLIKPQPQFPLTDPATLLALANLKYPMSGFNLPNYAHSLIQPRQPPASGIPNFDLASIIAAATAQDTSPSLNLSTLTTNVSLPNEPQTTTVTSSPPPPSTTTSSILSQLPIPIPAQPSSPTQSSASASSISSRGSSLIQSAQSSPTRQNGATTPMFGAGIKRKLNGTPTRKPPKPIPAEDKDQAYYERRKKNNDAAKRSRDARKLKEEQTAAKADFLQQENIQLRTQIEIMKAEMAKLQVMLLTQSSGDFSMTTSKDSDFSGASEDALVKKEVESS